MDRNYKYRIIFNKLRTQWRNPNLSRSAKVILFDLILYAGIDGKSFPSLSTLATNHKLTPRQVSNLLKELKSTGLITWVKGGYGLSNHYSFNEEIYFNIEGQSIKKSISSESGNPLPTSIGNTFLSKVVSESNQQIKSGIADKNPSNKKEAQLDVTPDLQPTTQAGVSAYDLWKRIDKGNFKSMGFFVKVSKKIPPSLLFQWASEIEQDSTIRNRGAVFNNKCEMWLSNQEKGSKSNG